MVVSQETNPVYDPNSGNYIFKLPNGKVILHGSKTIEDVPILKSVTLINNEGATNITLPASIRDRLVLTEAEREQLELVVGRGYELQDELLNGGHKARTLWEQTYWRAFRLTTELSGYVHESRRIPDQLVGEIDSLRKVS